MTTFRVPLNRPSLVNFSEVEESLRTIWRSGRITLGEHVARLEQLFCQRGKVKNAVAVSSGTAGLMLALRAMDLSGKVVMPSFTWTSTGHAAIWNNLTPVFCDSEPGGLTLDPAKVEQAMTPDVSAIIATNVFGLPPDLEALAAIAQKRGVKFIVDSAQGFGSKFNGRPAGGFGDCEVFSLSPTKGVTAGEGGMITTNDDGLAEVLRSLRDYGRGDDGDITRIGLSARQSEFHAAIAVKNTGNMEAGQQARARIVDEYRTRLGDLPMLSFQEMPEGRETCHTYFVVFVDENHAVNRDILHELLYTQGIETKKYFHPPLHLQAAYASYRNAYEGTLPVAEKAGREGLALPLYPQMSMDELETVCAAVASLV